MGITFSDTLPVRGCVYTQMSDINEISVVNKNGCTDKGSWLVAA